MRNIGTALSNILWFASSLKAFFSFRRACCNLRSSQIKILKTQSRNIKKLSLFPVNENEMLKEFSRLPLTEYDDYIDDIEAIRKGDSTRLTEKPATLLMPTSGTSGGTKLIPYTQELLSEYRNGTGRWIADMFLTFPYLLFGKHYWSITPNTVQKSDVQLIPIGFDNDTEYLGKFQRFFSNRIMAVPEEIAKITDMRVFEYITLLFLIKTRNLRFISVWHPSFLTILISKIPEYIDDIISDIASGEIKNKISSGRDVADKLRKRLSPDRKRAKELRGIDIKSANFAEHIWPKLKVISCWTGNSCSFHLKELQNLFRRVAIQPKGIVATEGIVSIPLGSEGRKVLAVNSHFYEFIDEKTKYTKYAWELEQNEIYSIVLTTGGGLCRYKLHDRVKITGFFREAPLLEFLGRDNQTSDIAGEKVNISQIENMIKKIDRQFELSAKFAGITADASVGASSVAAGRYRLYLYAPNCELRRFMHKIEETAEELLCENFHYRHARNLGQLEHLTVVQLKGNPTESIRKQYIDGGRRVGDIKIPLLLPEDTFGILEQCREVKK